MGFVAAEGALWHQAGASNMGIEAPFSPDDDWF